MNQEEEEHSSSNSKTSLSPSAISITRVSSPGDDAAVIYLPSNLSVLHQSWLKKKRPKGLSKLKSWQKRYCLLTSIGIYYFRSEEDASLRRYPAGSLPLEQISSVRLQPWKHQGLRFDIIMKTQSRVFAFMGTSPDEVGQWVENIRSALQTLREGDTDTIERKSSAWEDNTLSESAMKNAEIGVMMLKQSGLDSVKTHNALDTGKTLESPPLSEFEVVLSMGTGVFGAVSVVTRAEKMYYLLLVEQNMQDKVYERVIEIFDPNEMLNFGAYCRA